MTQEEKQLLLKDLCARLPYGVKICVDDNICTLLDINTEIGFHTIGFNKPDGNYNFCAMIEVKPYLRPMSSMTEEEKDELCKLCDFKQSFDDRDYFSHYGVEVICEYCVNGKKIPESFINYSVIDFFNEHHLDWRGLIPMGLALEAPEGMYECIKTE